jgi:hypothetical protein
MEIALKSNVYIPGEVGYPSYYRPQNRGTGRHCGQLTIDQETRIAAAASPAIPGR